MPDGGQEFICFMLLYNIRSKHYKSINVLSKNITTKKKNYIGYEK